MVAVLLLVAMAGAVAYGLGVLRPTGPGSDGLSGLVSVKGAVDAEALKLTSTEVSQINRAVDKHSEVFSKIDLYLDAKGDGEVTDKTVLVMALVLDCNGECEVRSWSRKVGRKDLVGQFVRYMDKAAKEYKQFKRYPDVKQSFKSLYI